MLKAQEPSSRYLAALRPPLVDHFDLVASAPGSVARVRELILRLAVRGKLVPQDPSDEPAETLVQRLAAEREGHLSRHARRTAGAEPLGASQPTGLPRSWRCVRLGTALEMTNGRAFKPSEWLSAGLPIVRIQNLNKEAAPFNYCDPATVDQRHKIESDDFLISWSGTPGTSFGAFIWRRGPAALNQHIFKCEPLAGIFIPEFLQIAINTQLHVLIARAQGGVGLQHVTKGTLESLVLTLPPKAEQARIVARVEELMHLCDALEAKGQLEDVQHGQLLNTLLGTLTASASPEELAANWQRVAAHFDLLLDRAGAVDALESVILLLAVRGLLARPSTSDDPVSVLLDSIRKDREHMNKGKRKSPRPMTGSTQAGAELFALPTHWTWCVLADLAIEGPSNGLSPKPVEGPMPVRCLTLSATTQGYFKPECFKYVDVPGEVVAPFFLKNGDLLIQRGNSLDYVGIAALYDGEDDAYMFPDLMMRVVLSSRVNPRFVHTWLVCEHGRDYFRRNATGTQGTMPKVNQATVAGTPVPLPPRTEQDRIVARVDQLRRLCADLREKLATAQTAQVRLADALVESAGSAD